MARVTSRTSGLGVFGPRALAFVVSGAFLFLAGCGSAGTSGGSDSSSSGLDGVFVTQSGYAACQEESRFHEMMKHIAEQESDAYRAMLADSASGCFPLAGDVEVEVLTWNITYAEIRPVGTSTSVWTVAEAVRRPDAPQDSSAEGPSPQGP